MQRITACRVPKDDKFLEVAVAGEAGVLVSDDKDLLTPDPYGGILIGPPDEFLGMLGPEQRRPPSR